MDFNVSPYTGANEKDYASVTKILLSEHPLSEESIVRFACEAWKLIWKSTIGEGEYAVPISDLDLPSQVIGFLFENIFIRMVAANYSDWRAGERKFDKDIVYKQNSKYSIEIKTSGQAGTKIYGNRSYGKSNENLNSVDKPDRSGYYLTINFYGRSLNLIRFGWIDSDDWLAQASETGQASSLKSSVYSGKLLILPGDYIFEADLRIISGVGNVAVEALKTVGIFNVNDIIKDNRNLAIIAKYKPSVLKFLASISDQRGSSL